MFSYSSIISGVSLPSTYLRVIFYSRDGSKYCFKNGFLILTAVRSNVCKEVLKANCLAKVISEPSSFKSLDFEMSRKVRVA